MTETHLRVRAAAFETDDYLPLLVSRVLRGDSRFKGLHSYFKRTQDYGIPGIGGGFRVKFRKICAKTKVMPFHQGLRDYSMDYERLPVDLYAGLPGWWPPRLALAQTGGFLSHELPEPRLQAGIMNPV